MPGGVIDGVRVEHNRQDSSAVDGHPVAMQRDEEITSDELNALLGNAETLDAARSSNATEMRL